MMNKAWLVGAIFLATAILALAQDDAPEVPNLQGTWVYRGEGTYARLELRADGVCTITVTQTASTGRARGTASRTVRGRYQVTPEAIVVTMPDGGERRLLYEQQDEDTLSVTMPDGTQVTLERAPQEATRKRQPGAPRRWWDPFGRLPFDAPGWPGWGLPGNPWPDTLPRWPWPDLRKKSPDDKEALPWPWGDWGDVLPPWPNPEMAPPGWWDPFTLPGWEVPGILRWWYWPGWPGQGEKGDNQVWEWAWPWDGNPEPIWPQQ